MSMEIRLAETAGFCFGVQKAVQLLEEELQKSGDRKVYTWGPIIHNREVVRSFEERGVITLNGEDDLAKVTGGTVIIRAHGVSEATYARLSAHNLQIVDGTCPFVSRIHETVREQSLLGRQIIITGDASHPEVKGIVGWCKGPSFVIADPNEARALSFPENTPLCVVSQTTYHHNKFKELVEIIGEKGYDILVFNTICNATRQRQTEAERIAGEADAMLVIGDRQSSNTQKLFEICKAQCNTYHIQTAADIDLSWFTDIRTLGITAGASTPNNIIMEVQNRCQS